MKTSDTFSINLDTVAAYRTELLAGGRIGPSSSMLVVVGNADTGGLEAQVRGSRHAWDMRLISVASLGNLVRLNGAARSPRTTERMRALLTPREFTRLDGLAEFLLLTAEDTADAREQQLVGTDEVPEEAVPSQAMVSDQGASARPPSAGSEARSVPPTDPAVIDAKRSRIVTAVGARGGALLVKRSRATYTSTDGTLRLACTISKRYPPPRYLYPYWFAYQPIWSDFLLGTEAGYLALGFADSDRAAVIPARFLEELLPGLNTTTPPDGATYWHLHLLQTPEGGLAIRLRGRPPVDLGGHIMDLGTGPDGAGEVAAQVAQPIARLMPVDGAKPRRPGALAGRIALTPEFFDPLPAEELEAWGER